MIAEINNSGGNNQRNICQRSKGCYQTTYFVEAARSNVSITRNYVQDNLQNKK